MHIYTNFFQYIFEKNYETLLRFQQYSNYKYFPISILCNLLFHNLKKLN